MAGGWSDDQYLARLVSALLDPSRLEQDSNGLCQLSADLAQVRLSQPRCQHPIKQGPVSDDAGILADKGGERIEAGRARPRYERHQVGCLVSREPPVPGLEPPAPCTD
jgi:hypothetical protein